MQYYLQTKLQNFFMSKVGYIIAKELIRIGFNSSSIVGLLGVLLLRYDGTIERQNIDIWEPHMSDFSILLKELILIRVANEH